MAFSEQIKQKVKKRAHFKCCVCQRPYVEVHHIDPQAEELDTEENAAPLCPSCHEIYGANPTKRKFIKDTRDHWYEICDHMYVYDHEKIDEIASRLSQAATKEDLENAVENLTNLFTQMVKQPNRTNKEVIQEISDVTAYISDVTSEIYITCESCGIITSQNDIINGNICPVCGDPLFK